MLSKNIFTDCPQLRESIGVLTARQTEIVNCNWVRSMKKDISRITLVRAATFVVATLLVVLFLPGSDT